MMRIHNIPAIVICASLLAAMLCAAPVLALWPYPDYATFITGFKALATSYPQLVSYETIGKTVFNKDILMFTIGNPAGGVVLFDGAIHGWESEGSQLLFLYAKWLLTSGDPLATHILANTCTLLVSVVNVDDYSLNRTNAHGVDLNRNFVSDWQYGGSTDPTNQNYRGASPLSEPESQALERVFQTRKPSAYVNIHDGGGELFYASSFLNSTYLSLVVSKINSMSAQRGVTPYSGPTVISGPGEAISDAAKAGVRTSLLLELGNGTRTLSEVNSLVLPRFIPIAVVLSQESENAVQNSVLFTDSFESADFSGWTGTQITPGETMSVTSLFSREGHRSAFFSSNGSGASGAAYGYKTLGPQATVYARGYFAATSFIQTANYSRFYFAAFAASGQNVAMVGCLKTGTTTSWRLAVIDGSSWSIVDSAASAFLNQWHRFELQWTQNPTDGYAKLYIDGKLVCSVTGINTTAYGSVDSARFGIVMSGNAKTTYYLDYVQVSRVSLGPLPIPADLNQDHTVDIGDLAILARAYEAATSSTYWDPRADLNLDSKIDLSDLCGLAPHYGEKTA